MSIDSKMLHTQLETRLKSKPQLVERVTAHVKAVSGHDSIEAFLENGADEPTKIEVLATCLRAVITGEFSKLRAEAPAPVAVAEPPKPVKMQPVWPPGNRMAEPIEVKAETTVTANEPPPVAHVSPEVAKHFGLDKLPPSLVKVDLPDTVDPKLAAVMAAIQELAKPQQHVPFNEEQTRNLIDRLVAQEVLKAKMDLLRAVDELFDKRMKKFCDQVANFADEL